MRSSTRDAPVIYCSAFCLCRVQLPLPALMSVLLFLLQAPRPLPPVMRGARKHVARRGSMSHEAFQVMLAPRLVSDVIDQISAYVVTPRLRQRRVALPVVCITVVSILACGPANHSTPRHTRSPACCGAPQVGSPQRPSLERSASRTVSEGAADHAGTHADLPISADSIHMEDLSPPRNSQVMHFQQQEVWAAVNI